MPCSPRYYLANGTKKSCKCCSTNPVSSSLQRGTKNPRSSSHASQTVVTAYHGAGRRLETQTATPERQRERENNSCFLPWLQVALCSLKVTGAPCSDQGQLRCRKCDSQMKKLLQRQAESHGPDRIQLAGFRAEGPGGMVHMELEETLWRGGGGGYGQLSPLLLSNLHLK